MQKWLIVVAVFLLLILMIGMLFYLYTNIEYLKSNPENFFLEKNNLNYCTCFGEGRIISFPQEEQSLDFKQEVFNGTRSNS